MALSSGSRLGPYEILAPLGAGGMGEVYRARDTRLDREVAIKVLPPATANDPAALARFEREAKAIAALSHPNILAIHDFGSSEGVVYAVTELLQGETLRQRVDRGALGQRRAVEIACEIAAGLAAAHERGIIHRDLKPANVFLTRDGLVKILDFGLARHVSRGAEEDTQQEYTEPGKVVGTASYMSPEQVRGATLDHRSDVFSFGCLLYEMLSGRRAFHRETSVETMNAILREDPPSLSSAERPVSASLERIVTHCLEKPPGDRFQSTRDLAFDLDSLSTATATPLSGPPATGKTRWTRRTAWIAAALAIAAAFAWAGSHFGTHVRVAPEPTFRRLTFRRGNLLSACFAPDERTVVYSAAWEGKPAELFSVRTDSRQSSPLGVERADILSISAKGELAILLKTNDLYQSTGVGTLARMPLGGGVPRPIMENVGWASWAPNGEDLAVLRRLENGRYRVEYPIGHALYEPNAIRRPIDVSPDGAFVAVADLIDADPPARIWAIDRNGAKRELVAEKQGFYGLAWSPFPAELAFLGARNKETWAVRAVNLEGHQRVLLPGIGENVYLKDVGAGGRMLVERATQRDGVGCRVPGGGQENEIGWFDGSWLADLAPDGGTVLFRELGEAGSGPDGGVYLRRCDGSPAVFLGDGMAQSLSPDGKWALARVGDPARIALLPTGAGSAREIPFSEGRIQQLFWMSDGKSIGVFHFEKDGLAIAVLGLDGQRQSHVVLARRGPHTSVNSPDGRFQTYSTAEGTLLTISLAGGEPRELPGPAIAPEEDLIQWSADGRYLFIARFGSNRVPIVRREIATGRATPWLVIEPKDPSGVVAINRIRMTRDGRGYAYGYSRMESSALFLAEGLR